MWTAVKLPPRLEPPQASPPQHQQQLTPALGMQILSFLDCLKTVNANDRARIKVVTSAKYREYSEMVVKGLRLAGSPVIPNEGDSSYLFPATSEFEAVVIRNRPGTQPIDSDQCSNCLHASWNNSNEQRIAGYRHFQLRADRNWRHRLT